jgi:hypothetical protein
LAQLLISNYKDGLKSKQENNADEGENNADEGEINANEREDKADESLLLYIDEKASGSGETILKAPKLAQELLETGFKSCKRTYIILDGIDECHRDERKEISTWFCQLIDGLPREDMDVIRCLFVSQDDGYARKDYYMLPSMKLTAADNKTDIEAYTTTWHRRIQDKFGPFDANLHVASIVTARAQGECWLHFHGPSSLS